MSDRSVRVGAGMESARDHGMTGDTPVGEVFKDATSGDRADNEGDRRRS